MKALDYSLFAGYLLLIGVVSSLFARQSPSVGAHRIIVVLCSLGIVVISVWSSLPSESIQLTQDVTRGADFSIVYAALWGLILLLLWRQPHQGPPGITLLFDGLVASGCIGFASLLITSITATAVTLTAATLALLQMGLLSCAFLVGAVMRGMLIRETAFPWSYSAVFSALLLVSAGYLPGYETLQFDHGHGIPIVVLFLVAMAVLHWVRYRAALSAIIGTLLALGLPLIYLIISLPDVNDV